MLITLHPHDFERELGRRKVLRTIHELLIRIHDLERKVDSLDRRERREERDIEKIFRTE